MGVEAWEQAIRGAARRVGPARAGDDELGPFAWLPGTWSNRTLPGHGWNLVALPYADPRGYRLLLNQVDETLAFRVADKGAANRGVDARAGAFVQQDQRVVALDYEQTIRQIAAEDFPDSGEAGPAGRFVHHEPGLFLRMTEPVARTLQRRPRIEQVPLDLARLATIPHGDAVLALGGFEIIEGPPTIPRISGLPVGTIHDLSSDYLKPYRIFADSPFQGLFDPTEPNALLADANRGVDIVRTTRIWFDSELETAGILNTPFVTRQANASAMRSTFWIQELRERDADGNPKLRLQYSQVVLLDFHLPRRDDGPGRVRWPHISINTLEKDPPGATRLL
ncbi:MAG: hypothetical protein H6737_06035 [Alphaproteobacteria bacterium]|nr:hypothetical protein [Alphaproteobacteria bacterium]